MMHSDDMFAGRTVLIAEDEYLLASEMAQDLSNLGASVIGPTGKLDAALDLIAQTPRIDVAVLDINLRGEMTFALADALRDRQVPILFATGYSDTMLPERYRDTPRCEKPVGVGQLRTAIKALMDPAPTA